MDKIGKAPQVSKKRDIFVRISCVVISVVLWFILSVTLFSMIYTTLKNVPIDFTLTGSYADIAGLSVVEADYDKINVQISGQRYIIGDYKPEDLEVTLNLDNVRAEGIYELPVVVKSKNGDAISVEEISPSTVKVKFDYIVSKTFSLEDETLDIQIPGISTGSDCTIDFENITASPSSVTVSGAKEQIDLITECVLRVNNEQVLTGSLSTSDVDLLLYNNNAVLDNSLFEFDQTSYNAIIPVIYRATVPFKVDFRGCPDTFDVSSIKYTTDPEEVTIMSSNKKIQTLSEISLGYLNLNEIIPGREFVMPIPKSNEYDVVSGIDTVTLNFDLEGYSERVVSLSGNQIYIKYAPSNYDANIETLKIGNVRLIGPEDQLESISAVDLVAEVNLIDWDVTEGTMTLPATVYSPNYPEVWSAGSYTVMVTFTEKDNDTVTVG